MAPVAAAADVLDPHDPTLSPAIRAAVEFLAAEQIRWWRAIHLHVPGANGWCVLHTARFPCLTFQLADAARRLAGECPHPVHPRSSDDAAHDAG
jgi:hypothetical protein